ncbi:hypothetical protein EVAR_64277_1 [Eumeta japonica]|uniref:ATP-dependent DNA helicase n=1 Tax=Eumeta variegata TaxID=151549 RepID=A0A4C2A7T8_EUMVA|nr:hypothetical protein EVAR_64277_1 [Eumeta japonica]
MAHKKSLEALNFTLKDLRRNNNIFGGLMILLAGDFRQTLPVVPRGTPADELNACLKASPLWNNEKLYCTHPRTEKESSVYWGLPCTAVLLPNDPRDNCEGSALSANLRRGGPPARLLYCFMRSRRFPAGFRMRRGVALASLALTVAFSGTAYCEPRSPQPPQVEPI